MIGTSKFENLVIDETFRLVEQETGFNREVLISRLRKNEVVSARFIAIYVVKKLTRLSLKSIGSVFNRDHSSIIHALAEVSIWSETPHRYIAEMIMLEKVTTAVSQALEMESRGMSKKAFV